MLSVNRPLVCYFHPYIQPEIIFHFNHLPRIFDKNIFYFEPCNYNSIPGEGKPLNESTVYISQFLWPTNEVVGR